MCSIGAVSWLMSGGFLNFGWQPTLRAHEAKSPTSQRGDHIRNDGSMRLEAYSYVGLSLYRPDQAFWIPGCFFVGTIGDDLCF